MGVVYLHWTERLPSMQPGTEGPQRWAAYASVHDALEQAAADDGLTARKITSDEGGDEVVRDKAAIAEYAKARAARDKQRDDEIQAAHMRHADARRKLAGD